VREFVAQLGGVVLVQAEAAVELTVEPDLRRVVVLHQHPLPNVELAPVYYERVLDVLLDDVLRLLAQRVVEDVGEVGQALDASAAG
jgi:hypothetical protein